MRIGADEENPYMLRWYVIPRNPLLNIYIHKFLRSDEDRALHDHPWWFASLVLKGSYWEHRADRPITGKSRRMAGSIAFRRPTAGHRVELEAEITDVSREYLQWSFDDPRRPYTSVVVNQDGSYRVLEKIEHPVWTLIVTGPRVREWGFLCANGWKQWRDFVHDNGCGEA